MANSSPFKVRGEELQFNRKKKKKRRRGTPELENIQTFILRIQRQQESLCNGFTVLHKGEEYAFVPYFVDRCVKTRKSAFTFKTNSYYEKNDINN